MATTADLMEMRGIASRAETIRWDVVNQLLHPIGWTFSASDQRITIELDTSRPVMRTVVGLRLPRADASQINPIRDRLKPVAVLENGDELPLGVFAFTDLSRLYEPDLSTTYEVSLGDLGVQLDQRIRHTISFPPHTTISAAIGTVLDLARVPRETTAITPTGLLLSDPLVWIAGEITYRKVLDDLCTLAGFLPPHYRNTGILNLVADASVDQGTLHASVEYRTDDPLAGRITSGSIVRSDNLLAAPNIYVAIDRAIRESPVVGVYEVAADAPHSIAERGWEIPEFVDASGFTSEQAAFAAAQARGVVDPNAFEWLQFAAIPDYRHDVFDIVAFNSVLYRSIGWSLDLIDGAGQTEMRHSLRRTWTGSSTETPGGAL